MLKFTYPEQQDNEDGAAYFERVRQMGLPYPWEKDKATPPGPITVEKQWSTRDLGGVGQLAADEQQARQRLAERPGHTLHYRWVWRAVGEWQDVEPERKRCYCNRPACEGCDALAAADCDRTGSCPAENAWHAPDCLRRTLTDAELQTGVVPPEDELRCRT